MRLRGALLAAFCLGAVLCLWGVFVLSHRGQVLEAAALKGSEIGAHYVTGHARTLLSVVSMPAAGVLVAIILLIGLLRRSHRRAVWAVVAGAVVTLAPLLWLRPAARTPGGCPRTSRLCGARLAPMRWRAPSTPRAGRSF